MRPIEFLFTFIDKFAPMEETDRTNLRVDGNKDYISVKNKLFESDGTLKKDIKPTGLMEWFVFYSEKWYVRTTLALFFVWLVPRVRDYVHPPKEAYESEFDDDYEEFDDEEDD